MKTYDAIVVGGGPAGATAARQLALLGYDVLLLEKTAVPRQKPCGGALSPKAYGQLDFDISDIVKSRVRLTRVRGPDWSSRLLESSPAEIWMVRREELDARLTDQASQAGATVRRGEEVRSIEEMGRIVNTDAEAYRARALVGADGHGSIVARTLALTSPRPRCFRSIHVEYPSRGHQADEAVLDFSYPGGYAWFFPKGEVLNAGVCSKESRWDLRPALEDFLRKEGVTPAGPPRYHSWPIPLGGCYRPLHQSTSVLVGDAAGLADPLLGEGIAYAIMSARLAARAIDGYLKGMTADLSSYSATIRRTLHRDLKGLSVVAALFYRFPRLFLALLWTGPGVRRLAINVLSGRRSLSGVWLDTYERPM